MVFDKLKNNLENNGFDVSVFETKEEASDYLDKVIDNVSVASGGSMTLQEMGILPRLAKHNNAILRNSEEPTSVTMKKQIQTDVYLLSANAVDESTGAIFNMDGFGNRISSSLFGHKKVYIIIGKNKIVSSFDEALKRINNVAAPKNVQRLNKQSPEKHYTPESIMKALAIHYRKVDSMDMEIVIVNEELGY